MSRSALDAYLAQLKEIVERGELEERIYSTAFVLSPFIISLVLTALIIIFVALSAITGSGYNIEYTSSFQGPQAGPAPDETLTVAALAALIGWFILAIIALSILEAYIIYKLVDRENVHWRRITLLYENLLGFLEALGVDHARLVALRSKVEELKMRLNTRSAALWAILYVLFGVVIFYILHFLSRDAYEHAILENSILEGVTNILSGYGVTVTPPLRFTKLHDRNTVLYIAASILTLGLFLIYWIYEANRDWNEHVAEHRVLERRLLEALSEASRKSQAGQTGA